jgi:hypothetical protein
LQYHSSQDTLVLFKCYWYDTNREIKVDLHHDMVKINKEVDFATSMMFLFLSNNVNKCIRHTFSSLERIIIELIGYPL